MVDWCEVGVITVAVCAVLFLVCICIYLCAVYSEAGDLVKQIFGYGALGCLGVGIISSLIIALGC